MFVNLWEKKEFEDHTGDSKCPTCSKKLIGDHDKGELICPSCGFVLVDNFLDRGPEWKAIDPEDKAKRVRAGSPSTYSIHDLGLSTDIGPLNVDSYGNRINAETRRAFESMKKWQSRIRTSSSTERGLSNVLSKISSLSTSLGLPKTVAETAALIYRHAVRKKVAKSKSILGMTAASVYLACRTCNVDRGLKQVARAAGIDKRVVAKYHRLLLNEVQTNYVPPPSVERYISKIVNLGKINPKVERLALLISSKINDTLISGGKAPAGLAAAYIYISTVMLGEHLPQREIAEIAEVTEVTVRNRCREILENYVIRQRLKPQITV